MKPMIAAIKTVITLGAIPVIGGLYIYSAHAKMCCRYPIEGKVCKLK